MDIEFELYTGVPELNEKTRNSLTAQCKVKRDFESINANDIFLHKLEIHFIIGCLKYTHFIEFEFRFDYNKKYWYLNIPDRSDYSQDETVCLHVFSNIAKLVKYDNPVEYSEYNYIWSPPKIAEIDGISYKNKILRLNYYHSLEVKITKRNRMYVFNVFNQINAAILSLFDQYENTYKEKYENIYKEKYENIYKEKYENIYKEKYENIYKEKYENIYKEKIRKHI